MLGLVDGKILFKANTGSLPFMLQTDMKYNDGKWHTAYVEKDGLG